MSNDTRAKHTGRAIEDEIRIEAPADAVWQAIADSSQVPNWFAHEAEGRLEAGETVAWSWKGGERMAFQVLEAQGPERVALELSFPGGASVLEITIEQVLAKIRYRF